MAVGHRAQAEAAGDFRAGERDCTVIAEEPAVLPEQRGDIVNQLPFPLDESGDDVEIVDLGKDSKIFSEWAGDRLGTIGIRLAWIELGPGSPSEMKPDPDPPGGGGSSVNTSQGHPTLLVGRAIGRVVRFGLQLPSFEHTGDHGHA